MRFCEETAAIISAGGVSEEPPGALASCPSTRGQIWCCSDMGMVTVRQQKKKLDKIGGTEASGSFILSLFGRNESEILIIARGWCKNT